MSLEHLRSRIDGLDDELLALLARRAEVAVEIARHKRAKKLPQRDTARERQILRRARAKAVTPLTPEAAEAALSAVIAATRTVATQYSAPVAAPRHIAIIGAGLIGGSIARALKMSSPAHEICAVDLEGNLNALRSSGLFESAHKPEDMLHAVKDAEVVFLCAPPAVNVELLPRLRAALPPTAVVTDTGSLKADVCTTAAKYFRRSHGPWFVGGHPMAGKASSGFANSTEALFVDRAWVLTPRRGHAVEPLKLLQRLIESTGAVLHLLTPEDHDRTAVVVSHMPQLLAVALALCVGGRDRGIAGPALLEMTRLADSPPELWTPLIHTQNAQVTIELQRLRSYLSELEMAATYRESLKPLFERASKFRRKLLDPDAT